LSVHRNDKVEIFQTALINFYNNKINLSRPKRVGFLHILFVLVKIYFNKILKIILK